LEYIYIELNLIKYLKKYLYYNKKRIKYTHYMSGKKIIIKKNNSNLSNNGQK